MAAPLRFITCGSVDDGKSTLIGRLLIDSQAVLQDQLQAIVHRNPTQADAQPDLALFTDGLSAEREQGITIDVAYRYFSTPKRKFIVGDAPGHEQYTRNMVTAASNADCAIVLIDALKLDGQNAAPQLLTQTRRHTLLAKLLGVGHIVFAINKLDAVADAAQAFKNISRSLEHFMALAKLHESSQSVHIMAVSALKGWNVVHPAPSAHWAGYDGPTILALLESLDASEQSFNSRAAKPSSEREIGSKDADFVMPVQWVEKNSQSAQTETGRRIYWGRLARGEAVIGSQIRVHPTGQTARIAKVLNHVRAPIDSDNNLYRSRGIVLDREIDISRGDYLLSAQSSQAHHPTLEQKSVSATLAWLDTEPLVQGRVYHLLHGHRWMKAKVSGVEHRLNLDSLEPEASFELSANSIGRVSLQLQENLPLTHYADHPSLGAAILVDPANNRTAAAVLF